MIKWLLLCYPIKFGVVCYAVIDNQYIGPLSSDFVSSKAKLWKNFAVQSSLDRTARTNGLLTSGQNS